MGLPQAPAVKEEVPPTLSTSVPNPPCFGGTGTYDLGKLPAGCSSSRAFPCPSINDFKRKSELDSLDGFDGHFRASHAVDRPAGFQGLNPDSRDPSSRSCSKFGPNVQMPAMRVVGFESDYASSTGGSDMMVADKMHLSLVIDNCHSSIEQHGPQARKRVLSPLNSVLPGQFRGDVLNIGSDDAKIQHSDSARQLYTSGFQDCKKANTATLDSFESPTWPALRYTNWSTEQGVDKFSSNISDRRFQNWDPESAPVSPRIGCIRSLSLLPVRRSLVGSFEESLLSGRYSCGKDNQNIDGFLAVLNVTGGNFSPPTQKLPFAVTSIDEDSSLLYYSSIDLAGRFPTNNSKSPKLKRSLSNNDSRSTKSRLRIPVKGRIQLVVSNPEKTPLHTFFFNYDLSDMPAGTKAVNRGRTATLLMNQKKEVAQTQHVAQWNVTLENQMLSGIQKMAPMLMVAAVK